MTLTQRQKPGTAFILTEVFRPLEQAKQKTQDDHTILREINVTEITKTPQKCRNRSAPGEDQISYLILKNLEYNYQILPKFTTHASEQATIP